jgi:hypothetical protein
MPLAPLTGGRAAALGREGLVVRPARPCDGMVIAAAAAAAAAAVPGLAVRPRHLDRCDQRCECRVRRRAHRDLRLCQP